MSTEALRQPLALLGLGLLSLALFGSSLLEKELPATQCARLLQATVTSPIDYVDGSMRLFPFGITCEYVTNGDTFSAEEASWIPAIPLAGGVLLIGGSAASLVRSRSRSQDSLARFRDPRSSSRRNRLADVQTRTSAGDTNAPSD